VHLEDFPLRLEELARRKGVEYELGVPISEEEMREVEVFLGVTFPEQVRMFYRNFNGFSVKNPRLEILPIEKLIRDSAGRLLFATMEHGRLIYFETSRTNQAGQWDIVAENGYRITLTMASFWSNKVWAWLDKSRPIWRDEGSSSCDNQQI
jgi:hypothetical protein